MAGEMATWRSSVQRSRDVFSFTCVQRSPPHAPAQRGSERPEGSLARRMNSRELLSER